MGQCGFRENAARAQANVREHRWLRDEFESVHDAVVVGYRWIAASLAHSRHNAWIAEYRKMPAGRADKNHATCDRWRAELIRTSDHSARDIK